MKCCVMTEKEKLQSMLTETDGLTAFFTVPGKTARLT